MRLGGSVPWEPKSAKFSRGVKPALGWKDIVVRVVVWVLQLYITILERVVGFRRGTPNGKAYPNGNGKVYSNGDGVVVGKTKVT